MITHILNRYGTERERETDRQTETDGEKGEAERRKIH